MRDNSDKTREGCTQENKPAISRRSKAWYKQQMVRFINLLLQLWRGIEASVLTWPFQTPTKSLPGYRNTGAVTVYRFHTNVPTTGKRLAKFIRPDWLLQFLDNRKPVESKGPVAAIPRQSKIGCKQRTRLINLLLQLWRGIEASVLTWPFQTPTKSLPGYRNTGAVTVYRFHTNVPTTGKRLAKFIRPGRLLVPRNSITKYLLNEAVPRS